MQTKLSETRTLPCHAHAELFCSISRHGRRTQSPNAIVSFCSLGLNFICRLHLQGYDKIK